MPSPRAISSVRLAESASAPDAASHVRTQLLRRVAHDIASPAGVTMTVLGELASSPLPRPDLVAMAQRSIRRLMRLSEQLALVAELEGDDIEPELVRVDLAELAAQALADAVAIDGRKDVVTSCETEPVVVSCDARLVALVLREIVSNALKLATGHVRVLVARDDAGRARIRVEDDGPGFSEEARATLGRRFVRRASSRGLGLSLSMAFDIAAAHGGAVEIGASSLPPGRRGAVGAAVTLTLPISAPAAL